MIETITGAKKIEDNENWRNIFDAHNDSVDAHDEIASDLAYIVHGNKCASAVAVGQYVLLMGSTISGLSDGAYKAAKAITANTAIDSTYLTAVSGGIANELNSNLTKQDITSQITLNTEKWTNFQDRTKFHKTGNIVTASLYLAFKDSLNADTNRLLFTVPDSLRPNVTWPAWNATVQFHNTGGFWTSDCYITQNRGSFYFHAKDAISSGYDLSVIAYIMWAV